MDVGAAVGSSLWVHLPEWEVVDGQVPEPAPGVVLGAAAIALQGRSEPLESDAFESGGPQGVVLVNGPTSSEASAEYVITGMVVKAGDMVADYGQGATHVGVELVLQVDDWQLYARVEGRATEISPHSRFPVRVRGELHLVENYNEDVVELREMRADWAVAEVRRLPDRDWLMRIELL